MVRGNARLGNGKKLYENGKSRAVRGRGTTVKGMGFVPSFYGLARTEMGDRICPWPQSAAIRRGKEETP